MTSPSKLNIGCGGTPLDGYVNLDKVDYPHVDICYDLNSGVRMHWRGGKDHTDPDRHFAREVPDNTFDEMAMIHTVEHVQNILRCMGELWRVAKPGCRLTIACPYGSTDNADEDPTHVRRIFGNSFVYFSQCWYGKNSYGYQGDWELQSVLFKLRKEYFTECTNSAQMRFRIKTLRNVVDEFSAGLVAIKPARKPGFTPIEPKTKYLPI